MNEVLTMLNDKTFLDNLYGFAYRRTNNSHEAEDLCSDIILKIISAVRRNPDISNAHAFVWTIARRVYADFSEKRKTAGNRHTAAYSDNITASHSNTIDAYIEDENDKLQLRRIMREIMFLSKIYRDVCVMYYLDEMKVSDIAKHLGVSENTVKQRLHSARGTIKKGVEKVESTNLTLKPMMMWFIGTGSPNGNDPAQVATRSLSKNLVYLCKNTERSVKELSEMLGVPMPFVEEEINIQVAGQNGYYGLLRKTENGKYISNIVIIDHDDFMQIDSMHRRYADILATELAAYIKENEQKILTMPFLNKQTDTGLIAWPLAVRVGWAFSEKLKAQVAQKYFAGIPQIAREFSSIGMAYKPEQAYDFRFYSCNGTYGNDIGDYAYVHITNMNSPRLKGHFWAGHNISMDAALLLTIRAIGGLPLSSLTDNEKETAAKAIEEGYLKKDGDMLSPKILVSECESIYNDMLADFYCRIDELVQPVVDEIYGFIKKYVPKHLLGDAELFVSLTANGIVDGIIEKCIQLGTLVPPPKGKPSAAGVIMTVTK